MILGPAKLSLVQECEQASDEPKAHTDRQLRAAAGRPWPQQQSGASVRAVADVTEEGLPADVTQERPPATFRHRIQNYSELKNSQLPTPLPSIF